LKVIPLCLSHRNPRPYWQKTGTIFTSFSWGEFFTSKIIRHRQEQVVITWSQVRTIKWMHKNLPTKLPEFLASHYRCVWPCVVLMEHNSFPIGQRWPLLGDCFLQTIQLLTVQIRIKSLEGAAHNRWFPANPTKHTANPSWPSILAWPSFAAHRDSTTTVFAWRCRKWPTFHHQSLSASEMGRFCCDSQMEIWLHEVFLFFY